ncbi:MAG: proline dehydrogenase family protein [Acidobacteriota bacterium]|nr:proline dehydrogenase family protein [Blastocatellia bacterium]MDW8412276.1 proline dehydrogenase family protein [Acidobacteriota bacterium]
MVAKNALLYLSRQEGLKNVLTKMKIFNKVTKRFVAGETIEQAVEVVKELNSRGIAASFDHLGESIKNEAEANAEVEEYARILDTINERDLKCGVSIKPTQLGLDINFDLFVKNASKIVEKAASCKRFVRIDMEDSGHTDATLQAFRQLRSKFDNVGIVIQAYLYRSKADVEALLKEGASIRLCKGAYDEPASVAFPKKSDTDANYIVLMQMMLDSGIYHGLATHDEAMINAAVEYTAKKGIDKKAFEFQMLYGVRRDLQEKLAREGYNVRVYVPYGSHWYPYFMRRLAERPANVWFVLKNMFKG